MRAGEKAKTVTVLTIRANMNYSAAHTLCFNVEHEHQAKVMNQISVVQLFQLDRFQFSLKLTYCLCVNCSTLRCMEHSFGLEIQGILRNEKKRESGKE